MNKLCFIAVILVSQAVLNQSALADAFADCPAQAFLTQGSAAQTFAVDLVAGDYRLLADDSAATEPVRTDFAASEFLAVDRTTTRAVNATGFNPLDGYIYGWSYRYQAPVRIHSDGAIESLQLPTATLSTAAAKNDFVAGDVHPRNNTYYVYKRGGEAGLFAIDLDPESGAYLGLVRVVDGVTLSLDIADLAISPMDELAYAMDNRGYLYQIDLLTGQKVVIAETGQSGIYGAAYFDASGNLYVSNNSDGAIYKIGISAGDYKLGLVAYGPSSSLNDGARCALAPVDNVADNQGGVISRVDFGDAPVSYGTRESDDGARHHLGSMPSLYLGSGVDGESNAATHPMSDDNNRVVDDEDGVGFVTTLIAGKISVVIVDASAPAYLNAWIDTDQNGVFDDIDHVIRDIPVNPGKQPLELQLPVMAQQGNSWARFRLSSTAGVGPTGAAEDGEVEDYPVQLMADNTTVNYYPSQQGWTSVAFEDNWPFEGDYDMNDLVVYMRTATYTKGLDAEANGLPGAVSKVEVTGEIAAVGSTYENGFAIRLPGVQRTQVDEANVLLTVNGKPVDWQVLEADREEVILIVSYNVSQHTNAGEFCQYYRTEPGCGGQVQMSFNLTVPMYEPVNVDLKGVYDPFLFATPGAWRGGHFAEAPGRSFEVHLKNQAPTEAFDERLFAIAGDDVSNPPESYFQNGQGLPWALEIGTRWNYPIEGQHIGHAYYLFQSFAETSGGLSSHWYERAHTNSELIFLH